MEESCPPDLVTVKQEEVRVKVEPEVVVKQEPGYLLPNTSLLKQPAIVFRSVRGEVVKHWSDTNRKRWLEVVK